MSEQNESSYQPSREELKQTEEMLSLDEERMSLERSGAIKTKESFLDGVTKVEQYLSLPEEKRADALLTMGDETLKDVYGDGFPSILMTTSYHGLSNFLTAHSEWAQMGCILAQEKLSNGLSKDHIKAAQELVDPYDRHSEKIIAKSEVLQRLLAPLKPVKQENQKLRDRGIFDKMAISKIGWNTEDYREIMRTWDQIVPDEDIEYLTQILEEQDIWHASFSQQWEIPRKKDRGAYYKTLDRRFGKLFRKFAIQAETQEESSDYKDEMEKAFERLVETA